MKNIQVIDKALNCTHSIFSVSNSEFEKIFPEGKDIEFNDDLYERLGHKQAKDLMSKIWERPMNKKNVKGIHGTLFYDLDYKKKYYPTKKEDEMIISLQ